MQQKDNSLHISDYAAIALLFFILMSFINIFLAIAGLSDIWLSLVFVGVSALFAIILVATFDPNKSALSKIKVDPVQLEMYKRRQLYYEDMIERREMMNHLAEIRRQTNPYTRFGKWGGDDA